MQNRIGLILLMTLVPGIVPHGLADDPARARAIVNQAIQVRGGAAKLTRYPAFTSQVKGTFRLSEVAIPFTGEWSAQGSSQNRLTLNGELMKVKFQNFRIINGAYRSSRPKQSSPG